MISCGCGAAFSSPTAPGPTAHLGPLLDAHRIDRILSVRSGRGTNAPGLSLPAAGPKRMGAARRAGRRRTVRPAFRRPHPALPQPREGASPWKALDLRQSGLPSRGGSSGAADRPAHAPTAGAFRRLLARPQRTLRRSRRGGPLPECLRPGGRTAAAGAGDAMAAGPGHGPDRIGTGKRTGGDRGRSGRAPPPGPLAPRQPRERATNRRRRRSPPGSWRRTTAAHRRRCCWPCGPLGGRWPPIPTTPAPSCCWAKPMFAWPSQTREQSWQGVLPALRRRPSRPGAYRPGTGGRPSAGPRPGARLAGPALLCRTISSIARSTISAPGCGSPNRRSRARPRSGVGRRSTPRAGADVDTMDSLVETSREDLRSQHGGQDRSLQGLRPGQPGGSSRPDAQGAGHAAGIASRDLRQGRASSCNWNS